MKLKGFSLDVTKKDIKDFYIELDIKEKDINLLRYPDGRSTGYAFLRLKNSNEIDLALLQDNRYMGNQYVSVTKSSLEEMTMIQSLVDQKKPIYVLRSAEATAARSVRDRSPLNYNSGSPPMLNIDEGSNVVFVMGIPSRKGYKEVRRFFSGCRIQPGGVYLCCGDSERHNGTAYVEFVDQAECAKAKDRDGCLMGDNCVVVSGCSKEEMFDYLKKFPKNDTKNNWTESYTTSSGSERKVYHSRSERRVHRNEDGGRSEEEDHRLGEYDEDGGWLMDEPPQHRENKDPYVHHDIDGDSGGRHRRHHSRGHRSHSSSGGYHSSNGSDRKVHRTSHHRNEEEDGLHQGEQFYTRRHYHGDHHRSSRHRDKGYMEGSSSYLDNSGDWSKLDASLNSGTGEPEIDPLLALELLKTAVQVSSTGSQRGISSSSLYSSSSHSRRGYDDQPLSISSHYSSSTSSSKGIVLMEGLPYEATIGDILDFFRNYNLTYENVRIQCRDDGSPSGKAFVTFLDADTAKLAARQLNKGYIGGRYVELKLV